MPTAFAALPVGVTPHLPQGYAVLGSATMRVGVPARSIVVVALGRDAKPGEVHTPARPLLIFAQRPDGAFTCIGRNDTVVSPAETPGQCDPFLDGGGVIVAIDGSKFKAVNARDKCYTQSVIQRRMEQVEASVARYLAALDTADRHDLGVPTAKVQRLREKLDRLREQMRHLREMEKVVAASPDKQVCLTDPDARAMTSSGRGSTVVGYNVQTAVDTTHHLIVAHEVTNATSDRAQLAPMGQQAQEATGRTALTVLADRGYFSGRQIVACEKAGMMPYMPKPYTSGAKAEGRFGKQDFVYVPGENVYRCPAGERLTWRSDSVENGMTLHSYWTDGCGTCVLKPECTTGQQRRIKRWEHKGVLDAMQRRLAQVSQAMLLRRRTVEHPFGTIKAWMGSTHFLTRTLKRVSTEMSLQVLAYNMKRVIAILGVRPLMEAIQA